MVSVDRQSQDRARESSDTLARVGELAALARIVPRLPAAGATLLGPGDDAAVVAAPDGRVVVTTDSMIEGPDFRLDWSTPHDLGWKAAASNLADVAAMGATPTALVVALAAPASTEVAVLEGIADGLRDACAALAPGCGVVGGDLATAPALTIAVTAFGDLEGRDPVRRSGARPGDLVAVSGDLAGAPLGLAILAAASASAASAASTSSSAASATVTVAATVLEHPAVRAQLAPHPPIEDGAAAAVAGATSMLDVSDGLFLDARRIATASGVRLALEGVLLAEAPGPTGMVPVGVEPGPLGAESHALLATFPDDARALPGGFRVIGRVEAGVGVTIDGAEPSGVGGWDPFRDYAGDSTAGDRSSVDPSSGLGSPGPR